MNPFVKIMLLTVCSTGILCGEGKPALFRLPLPDSISAFKTSPQEKKEFLSLLHEKELPDCCREARKRLGAFSSKGAGDVNAEDVRVLSWIFYAVSSMDVFPLNYDENTPKDGLCDNMDYNLKVRVVEWMSVLSRDISGIVSRCGVKRKELCRIWSEYGAAVLKTFRTQYDPELKRKQARMKEEYDKMSAAEPLPPVFPRIRRKPASSWETPPVFLPRQACLRQWPELRKPR